ncbi:MAG: DUF4919 domain-containing protein [Pyrinomonadaceae bacterium]
MNRLMVVSCLLVVCFAAAISVSAQGRMRPVEPQKDPEFTKLVEKLKGGDTSIDYRALRVAWARSDFPGARGIDPKLRMKLVESVKANKYDDIAKTADEMLKINPMDINTRATAAAAFLELKDAKKYDYHLAVYQGLINSIVGSADGESQKTAYMVVSRDEMIAVLKAYDLQTTASEELIEGTNRYQIVTAADKSNGGTSKVYFNVDMMPKMPERPERPAKP